MARWIMDVLPEKPLYNLIANASSFVINIEKHQRRAAAFPRGLQSIYNRSTEHSPYQMMHVLPDSVNYMHCKAAPVGLQQTHHHETV